VQPPPPPPDLGTCCRPIHLGCVGKKYRFTANFLKLRYPCFASTGLFARYRCPSGTLVPAGSTWLGEPEHWRLTVNYEIKTATMVKGVQGQFNRTGGGGGGIGTLVNVSPPTCTTPDNICNFTPGATDQCKGGTNLLNPAEGIAEFRGCYNSYQIRDPQNTCTPNANLTSDSVNNLTGVSNYSFQFIPSSTQIATNYSPVLTPNLLFFSLNCRTDLFDFITNNRVIPYGITLKLGFGLQTQARCSGVLTPIIRPFNITFANDGVFNEPIYDGLYLANVYTRSLIGTDPMNMCFPKNSQIYNIPGGCYTSVPADMQCFTFNRSTAFKDEFSTCIKDVSPFVTAGFPTFGYGGSLLGYVPFASCDSTVSNDFFNSTTFPQACSNYQVDSLIEVLDVT
jgi:hypothetical protein